MMSLRSADRAAGPIAAATDQRSDRLWAKAREWRDATIRQRELTVFMATLILFVILATSVPEFFTTANLIALFRQIALIGIIAVAMTFLIIAGEFDISVGSVVGFTGVLMAVLIAQYGWNPWLALVAILGIGAGIGSLNAFFVTKIGLPSFIVTLAGLSLWRGAAMVVSGGWPISVRSSYGEDAAIYAVSGGNVLGLPVHVIWLIVIAVIGGWVLTTTRFGAHVYATGGNEKAARVMGINTKRVKTICFIMTGVFSALAGALLLGFLRSAQPLSAAALELEVIAAVIIGGTALYGGAGRVIGTILGAFLIGMIRNGMILAGASAYWQEVAVGSVILAAVTTEVLMRRPNPSFR